MARKPPEKRINKLILVVIICIIAISSFLILATLFPTQEFCGEQSFNYECICEEGQVKQGMFPWRCEDLPEIPSEVTLPIETWEEARAYAVELLGGFECTGNYQYDSFLSGEIYKQCDKYGSVMTTNENEGYKTYKGNIVIMECRSLERVDSEGKPTGGHIVFSVRFDPNDGHVYEISCKDNLINCPDITFKDNYREVDPEPTCGDFCCHYGETFENCPSDCEELQQEPIDCSSSELIDWIEINGGASGYDKLCGLVGGEVSIYKTLSFPGCDYEKKWCVIGGLGGDRVLIWKINKGGVCGQYNLVNYWHEKICPTVVGQ